MIINLNDKYEYSVKSILKEKSKENLEKFLNKAGEEGWELVLSEDSTNESYRNYIFKRQIKKEA